MVGDRITLNALPNTYKTEGEADFASLVFNAVDPTPDGELSTDDKKAVAAKLKEFDSNQDGILHQIEFQNNLEGKIETLMAQKTIADRGALGVLRKYSDANGRVEIDVEERMTTADLKAYDAYTDQSMDLTEKLLDYVDLQDAIFEDAQDDRP